MTKKWELTLPEKVIDALGFGSDDVGAAVKCELAVSLFQRHSLTFGQARELAELSVWDFLELLRERKVPLHYGFPEYEEDLKTIQEL
jgi:predicted HTH domain antitoxin